MINWVFRLAVLSILVFPVMVVLKITGVISFLQASKAIEWSVYLACIIFSSSILVCVFKKQATKKAKGKLAISVLISLIPIIFAVHLTYTAKSVPPIHNISTDTVDPPKFVEILNRRKKTDNPTAYDVKLAQVQQQGYPHIRTLKTTLSVEESFNQSVRIAEKLGWEIVAKIPDQGRIEATQTTRLWRFKDDIVIRIKQSSSNPELTKVDLRSVSRQGVSDLGANAQRISDFVSAFTE